MGQSLGDRMLGLTGLVIISFAISGLWWLIKYIKEAPERKEQKKLLAESSKVSPDGKKMCVYCKEFTEDEFTKDAVLCVVCGRQRYDNSQKIQPNSDANTKKQTGEKKYIKLALETLRGKKEAFEATYCEARYTLHSFVFLAVLILASMIGSWPVIARTAETPFEMTYMFVSGIIYSVFSWALFFLTVMFLIKVVIYRGQSFSKMGLFRVMVLCSTPSLFRVLGMIVPLGLIVYPATVIWTLILSLLAVKQITRYGKRISLVIFFILAYIFQVVASSIIAVASSYLFGTVLYFYNQIM